MKGRQGAPGAWYKRGREVTGGGSRGTGSGIPKAAGSWRNCGGGIMQLCAKFLQYFATKKAPRGGLRTQTYFRETRARKRNRKPEIRLRLQASKEAEASKRRAGTWIKGYEKREV